MEMFSQKILTFHSWEKIYWNSSVWDLDYMLPKELAKPQYQIRNVYFRKGNSSNLEIWISYTVLLKFHNSFWRYVVPYADS